jgi:hypothetical protein
MFGMRIRRWVGGDQGQNFERGIVQEARGMAYLFAGHYNTPPYEKDF